jgi:N-acetylglucosamine-6-phosphate deacetylase
LLYIHHATLLTPDQTIEEAAVLTDDERIVAAGPTSQIACPPDAQAIDATGLYLAPGFVELQLNGGFGLDFTARPESIWQVAARLPQYGVTSFLPTVITSPLDNMATAQAVWLAGPPRDFSGARPLGLHIEGPFLNPAKRGAHNPAYLRQPDLDAVANWSPERGVRLVTLAPELPGALDLIRTLTRRGVVVSAGHSMASYEQARAGFDAGITYGTHLFNAMPPLEHRAPGLAGALLADARAVVGIIPDGIHLHPGIVELVWKSKGVGRVSPVTDAMAALGMPPGRYELGDFAVRVDETSARLEDGRLAGSILSLDQGVRNLCAFTGCALSEALATVTTTPAQVLGLSDRGRIAVGGRADLVLLTREAQVVTTIVGGKITWESMGKRRVTA